MDINHQSPSIRLIDIKWDGSYLGKWSDLKICEKFKHSDQNYLRLNIQGKDIVVRTKRYETPYSCLVDEMKPWFHLPKEGRHWLQRGKCVQVIIRVPVVFDQTSQIFNITEFPRLNQVSSKLREIYEFQPDLPNLIRRNLAFRLITGVKQTNQSSLILYWEDISPENIQNKSSENNKWKYYLISVNEGSPSDPGMDNLLPDVILNKWFSEESIEKTIIQMSSICPSNDETDQYLQITTYLSKTQNFLDSLVNRIDRQLIIHIQGIIRRLSLRLTSLINAELLLPSKKIFQEDDPFLKNLPKEDGQPARL